MAVECLVRLLQGKVTSHDLVRASLSRIEAVNPYLNSVVTLCEEMAIQKAHAMDAECKNNPSLRLERGILGGLPLLIKDLNNVKDVRTTYGCRVFENCEQFNLNSNLSKGKKRRRKKADKKLV